MRATQPRTEDPWSQDLAGRPPIQAQPDPGLELLAAEQEAVNDAGRSVLDTASLLVSDRPIEYAPKTASWLRAQQVQAELAGQQAVAAGEVIAHQIDLGTDPQAPEHEVGRAGYQHRHSTATHDEEAAEAATDQTRRKVLEHGAAVPETTSAGAYLRFWATIWSPKATFVVLDTIVSAAAYGTAVTGSEQSGENWVFATIVGLATAIVATSLGKTMRAVRAGEPRRLTIGLTTAALAVLGMTIAVVAWIRGRAVDAALAMLRYEMLPADGQADAITAGQIEALSARANGTHVALLVATVLVVSAFAVAFLHLRSAAPEQLEHVRALRNLKRARARTADVVQKVDSVRARVEFAAHDVERAQAEWGFYADVVLPGLAEQKVHTYRAELARQVGDPGFTDSLHSLPAHQAFSPVPAAQLAVQP